MAYATQTSLSFLLIFDNQKHSTFAIQAIGSKGTNSEAPSHELWISTLIRDGQRLRGEFVDNTINWELEVRDRGQPPSLIYRESSKPALLTFQGKSMLIIFLTRPWSGVLSVRRDGVEVKMVDLRDMNEQHHLIVIENPEAPPSVAVFMGALILFAGLAWWFGPIRAGRPNIPWLILFLSVIHFLFWTNQCVGTSNDSPDYLRDASLFFLKGEPLYFPPGYPALLEVVGAFSGDTLGRWVTLVQHGMAVLGGVWIYLLLRRIVSEELALIGTILAGALAPSMITSQAVLSEASTLFAIVGAFYFTVRSAETGKLLFAILAGLLTGWSGILRITPLVALLPSICMVQLLPFSKEGFRRFSITLIITATFLLLPVLWCWYKSGQPKLTNSLGFHLFNRVVTDQKLLDKEGTATRTLLTLLEGKDPRGIPHWEITNQNGLRKLNNLDAEFLLREVSLEGISSDPWGFLVYTPQLAWRLFLTPSLWIPPWGDSILVNPRLENPPPLIFTASSLAWRWTLVEVHRVLWPIICWTAVAGTFLGLLLPQRILILALAWIPAGYLLSSAFLEQFDARYNTVVVPFVVVLSMVTIGNILTFLNLKQVNRKMA